MYDPQIGRFSTQDRLAFKYMPMSPYQYTGNNPILLIDINGDYIDVSKLDKDQAEAFSKFVHTKQGKKFLAQYASQGQTIYGVKFDKQGKFDKKNININYTTADSKETSTTEIKENKQGGIDINIEIAKEGFGSANKTLNLVGSITHESFIHADMGTKDWLDDNKLNLSNLSEWTKKNLPNDFLYSQLKVHGDHYEVSKNFFTDQKNNTSLWPAQALEVLKTVSSELDLKFTNSELKSRMWDFSGSLINVDAKTGKVTWKK